MTKPKNYILLFLLLAVFSNLLLSQETSDEPKLNFRKLILSVVIKGTDRVSDLTDIQVGNVNFGTVDAENPDVYDVDFENMSLEDIYIKGVRLSNLELSNEDADFARVFPSYIWNYQVLPWKIGEDFLPALKQLLEVGPNTWVELNNKPKGKYIYQRGLSGGLGEALNLISARQEPLRRCVSFVANPDFSDVLAHRINAGYSDPLTIRGRTDSFAKMDYADEVTEELASNLSNADFNNCFCDGCPNGLSESCLVGSRGGETQHLRVGNTIDSVEAFGFFIPKTGFFGSSRWATSYVEFYEALIELGVEPNQDTHGYKFYAGLKELISEEDFSKSDAGRLFEFFADYYGGRYMSAEL